MKLLRLISLFSALALPGLIACGDGRAPNEPVSTSGIDLSGHWTGTVTSFPTREDTDAFCRPESIAGDVTQRGADVGGSLLATCAGTLELTARVEGNSLTGTLTGGSNGVAGGRVSAAVSNSRILMTVGRSTRDRFIPVLSVDLSR